MQETQKQDSGYVVFSEKLGCFWTGLGWDGQLRTAKTYHWKSKAQDIVDRFPNQDCHIYEIKISLQTY